MKFAINLVFLLAIFPAQAETVLRFQAHITPQAKRVGDLLLITPDPHHWSKIILDSQPRDGARLNKKQIITWLQNKVGVFSYQWKGKNTAIIRIIVRTKAQDLLNKARQALAQQLKSQAYSQVLLNSKTLLKDSDIPLTDFSVQVPKKYPIAKRVCLHLNSKKRSIPVWFAVKAYQAVFVAQHKIKQHTLLHSEDIALQRRNIAGLKNPPLTQFPQRVWLTRSINKNQILTHDDVRTTPEVMQGHKVNVNVRQHGISIMMEALAQSDAYLGQAVRMQNPQTNKYFVATVTGKNQAEIVE
ncbi:flagellar basal body P-ring formation chaperone FlgA [Legionella drancourtii]|uniref:Flagella basal body P-ring formation protein FlgA SAF domain-containing protein n=1 Tax=Legionella drancourtii LLAP12 TaxID=658187 RepID=G9EQY6_9GAMM|nr:flagellar basal body P-ring formation chaperone FlgA [Legionella drancourtii]EHL30357.1 hypothetical protein LDG_7690 [Legionella drancourtii LLAP12]